MKEVKWKREEAQDRAWRETENGNNTVNTSPEAERGAERYLETRTSVAWMPLSKTPPLPGRDFYLLLGFLSPGLPHGPRMVVIYPGYQHMVLNGI